ncbi:Frag1/DRAM/Sfk1 family protein [Ceratobasidium theobromae]|uniref:Frag1/DRAM/Sfk1 family protein n=1 Tax=Ceratobasidium theobromae TaxID=1582974 RepID=A0A5N5QEP0_9AGAM|nr:Frag1/DRAM/Sfk1 family protein [Ceratobasidium theobromae]
MSRNQGKQYLSPIPYMYGLHAWMLPLAGAFMWCATLLAMMITWAATGKPKYPSQEGNIPYISDVGAYTLKPLFVVGAVITGLGFFFTVLAETILRTRGRLLPAVRRRGVVLGVISCIWALVAAAGLGLLAGFDTWRYSTLHRLFLLIFMLGTVFSAIASTIEFLVLKREARHAAGLSDTTDFTFNIVKMVKGLTVSYIAKLILVVTEVALSFAFGVTMYKRWNNTAAILEWAIAYIFTFYLLTFYFDLRPAARTKDGHYDVSGVGDRLRLELGGRGSHNGRPSASGTVGGSSTPEMAQVIGATSQRA